MIKILFLMDNITEGGAEKVLRTLVNNMDQKQFEITVQTAVEADAAKYLVPGIRYKAFNRCKTDLGQKLFSWWIRLCAEMNWLYPLYIRDDYDVEVAYLECGPTKYLSGSTNTKAVKLAWVHCDLERKGIVPTKKLCSIYSNYDRVICVSENVRDSFQKLFGNTPESLVLHNVIDEAEILSRAEEFIPFRPEKFTFLAVGRLTHQKGFDRLLEACSMLKSAGCDFCLQILGEGPDRPELEEQIKSLNLLDSVQLLGFQENPYPYMRAADCIICTSRYEGFSTVVTEALILGKAIITTPCTGMQELLGNSEFGLICGDDIPGIFQGMMQMHADTQLVRSYEKRALQRASNFALHSSLQNTEFLFHSLLNIRKNAEQDYENERKHS